MYLPTHTYIYMHFTSLISVSLKQLFAFKKLHQFDFAGMVRVRWPFYGYLTGLSQFKVESSSHCYNYQCSNGTVRKDYGKDTVTRGEMESMDKRAHGDIVKIG